LNIRHTAPVLGGIVDGQSVRRADGPYEFRRQRAASVGRNVRTLHEMVDHRRHRVVLADDLALGKFSTSEHHLDTEGVEALRNNGFTFANHAARTNDIKLNPMSIAPITINPIRAATGMAPRDAFQSNLNFEAIVAPFAPVPHWTEAW
jgi:hypothetical protein